MQIPAGPAGHLLRPQRLGGTTDPQGFGLARPLQDRPVRKAPGQRRTLLVSSTSKLYFFKIRNSKKNSTTEFLEKLRSCYGRIVSDN